MVPIVDSLLEAETWFLNNSSGDVVCRKSNGEQLKVSSYPQAKKFYKEG